MIASWAEQKNLSKQIGKTYLKKVTKINAVTKIILKTNEGIRKFGF